MLAMTLVAVSLPSAVLGVVVYRMACRLVARDTYALAAGLIYGLATVAFPYSKAMFQHQVSAFGAFVGFYLLWRVAREDAAPWRLWVAGALFGLATISEYPVAPFLLLLVLWAWRELPRPWALHRVVWGALPLGLLFAAYNWVIFHTPFPAGYRYHVEYHDVHGQGFMGFTGPTWAALYGITVSPYRGLFFLSPVLLLSLPGPRSALARSPLPLDRRAGGAPARGIPALRGVVPVLVRRGRGRAAVPRAAGPVPDAAAHAGLERMVAALARAGRCSGP